MKIERVTREVEQVGALASQQFTMVPGPHLMLLLSKLYSDPIGAVVREIGTNMYDAYQMLPEGAEILPPRIHVPSTREPWIEFTDFGVGLPRDDVMRKYTVYGESTKRGATGDMTPEDAAAADLAAQKQVGALGLGCKAPFAYEGADQWVVESRFLGQKHLFSAFVDATGTPTMNHMQTVPTDEHSGVSVRVPVAPKDISRFSVAIQAFARYFPMPITLTGDPAFRVPPLSYTHRYNNWGITNKSGENHVIMGNVAYPVSTHDFYTHTDLEYKHLSHLSLDLYLPIGAVEFTPSREHLMYTEKTIAGLKAAVSAFFQDLTAYTEERVADCLTKWSVLRRVYELWEVGNLSEKLGTITWEGEPLNLAKGIEVDYAALAAGTLPGLVVQRFSNEHTGRVSQINDEQVVTGRFRPAKPHRYVIIDDLNDPKSVRRRVKHFLGYSLKESSGRSRQRWVMGRADVLQVPTYNLSRAHVMQLLGGFPQVQYASYLDDPYIPVARRPKKERLPSEKDYITVKKLDYNGSGRSGELRDVRLYLPELKHIYFVRMSGNDLLDAPRGAVYPRGASQYFYHAKTLGLVPQDALLFFVPRFAARVEKAPGWTDLATVVTDEKIAAAFKKCEKDLLIYTAWHDALASGMAHLFAQIDEEQATRLKRGSLAAKFWREVHAAAQVVERTSELPRVAKEFHVTLPSLEALSEFKHFRPDYDYEYGQFRGQTDPNTPPNPCAAVEARVAEIETAYPLVSLLVEQRQGQLYPTTNVTKDIVDYLNLVKA